MRLRLERVPEEDQDVEIALADARSHLLVTAQRSALEACDIEAGARRDQGSGGAGGEQLVLAQHISVELHPLEQVLLPAVVRDQHDLLHVLHLHSGHPNLTGGVVSWCGARASEGKAASRSRSSRLDARGSRTR